MKFSFKDAALSLDPSLRLSQEPFVWPDTPEGKTGRRWVVRNGQGDALALGDLADPRSAWRRAFVALDPR